MLSDSITDEIRGIRRKLAALPPRVAPGHDEQKDAAELPSAVSYLASQSRQPADL